MSERNLTDADIEAITTALREEQHACRFTDITTEDMVEAVKFFKHFNGIMQESGSMIRKTLIVVGVTGLITIVGVGAVTKFKQIMGP